MTILAVSQEVALAVGLARPIVVFTNTAREWMEMQSVANEAARTIAEAFDWQRLKKVATLSGDGAAEDFDLPDDYGRMAQTSRIWSSRHSWSMDHVADSDEWIEMERWPSPLAAGVWTIFGGQFHIRPVMAISETARFFYITDQIVSGGKPAFTTDADTFVLDERLLKLGMIQLWKQKKGQDFTAELADYELALMQAIAKDGGAKSVLTGNGGARSVNVWPGKVLA